MKYVIDPYCFSFDKDMSEEELEHYVESIMEMDELRKRNGDDVLVLSDMDDLLHTHGFFPVYDKLNPLLEKYNLEYDYKDITIVINRFFKLHTLDIDEGDELFEKESVEIEPDTCIANRLYEFQNAFKDILWYSHCYSRLEGIAPEGIVIFSRDIDSYVKASFSIYSLNEEGKATIIGEDSSFRCYPTLTAFYQDRDTPFKMWRFNTSKFDLDIGLRCRVMQEESMSEIDDVKDKYTFVLQDSFYEDFCDCRYACRSDVVRNTVENMAMVIMDRHVEEHNVKKKPTKGAPYQYHGDYSAMRRKCYGSLRIHYWKHTPSYRFANIGEHDLTNIKWEDD